MDISAVVLGGAGMWRGVREISTLNFQRLIFNEPQRSGCHPPDKDMELGFPWRVRGLRWIVSECVLHVWLSSFRESGIRCGYDGRTSLDNGVAFCSKRLSRNG